jgi:hypothetical protein
MVAKQNEVVAAQSNGLALPSDVLARLAAKAQNVAAAERPSVSKFGLKSGVLSYGGNPIPNNEVEVIVLTAVHRNTWYAGRYDPNNIVNPNCFSMSLSGEDMVPDKVVTDPPHSTCKGCPKSEWKSDPNTLKGKACKESRRLVLIPATVLQDADPAAAVMAAELAIMDLPVTSGKNYSNFVNSLAAVANVPPYAAVTNIKVTPDAKTQFKVNFTPLNVVPSMEILDAIEKRIPEAERLGMQGYDDVASNVPSPRETERKTKF